MRGLFLGEVLIGLALVVGCTGDERRLRAAAPDLSPVMLQHLLHDDNDDFRRHSLQTGIKDLIDARLTLRRALRYASPAEYTRTAALLMPHIGRLSRHLAADYGCHDYYRDYDFWRSLPAERAAELTRLEAEMNEVYLDPDLLLVEKTVRLQEYARSFRAAGYWMGAVVAQLAIAEFTSALGLDEERRNHLRSALGAARRQELTILTCQILGVMGSVHKAAGRIDSMAICWNEALLRSTTYRLPEHAASINSYYASHYAGEGQLALAAGLHQTALDVCREYKGGYLELRFLLDAMYFHAELGFWELVGQLLQRARVLSREYARSPRIIEHRLYAVRLDEMEARYMCAQGRIAGAEAIFNRLEEESRGLPSRIDYPRLLYSWAAGLLAGGQPAAALPVIGKGVVHAIAGSLPGTRARFAVLLAKALWQLGNESAALQSLQDFTELAQELGFPATRSLRREWVMHDAIRARLLLGRGDRAGAAETLRRGILRLGGYLVGTDASAPGYIFLEGCDDLRLAMHAALGDDARAGYDLEMGWRRLTTMLGKGEHRAGATMAPVRARGTAAPQRDLAAAAYLAELLDRKVAASAPAATRPASTLHCAYLCTPEAILRWTAGDGRVRRDTLAVAPTAARRLVARAMDLMTRDPADPDAAPPTELVRVLRQLGAALLPMEIRAHAADQQPELLLLSPDDFLALVPFEAFNLAGDDYRPLLLKSDVAYLRYDDDRRRPRARGAGAILADPQLSPAIRRQYPHLADLDQGVAEAQMVAAAFPGSRVLMQAEATKPRLFELWSQAPFLYAAAHFVRDPEVPYLTFFPMTPPPGAHRPDAAYLDIEDIRAADLSSCRLVVLSGCASGSPYVAAGRSAPGLGDAFLDAGAGAVVQTFWFVRDDQARLLMRDFVKAWSGDGELPVRALCTARRARMQGPRGIRHPFSWASYSIKLGRYGS